MIFIMIKNYPNDSCWLFNPDVALVFQLIVSVLFHGFEDSSKERFQLEIEAGSDQREDGFVGGFQVVDFSVEVIVHLFEDGAVLETHLRNVLDVRFLHVLEDNVRDTKGFEEYDDLSIEEPRLVLVIIQNIEVLSCCLILAPVLDHTWS